jgi:hypothetical protein
LTPIIDQISAAITAATSSLKSLDGQPTSVILASADGLTTLDVSDIAGIIAEIVIVRLSTVGFATVA